MVVVDTNILVYLLLPSDFSLDVEKLYETDSDWCAPYLWKSEFRNVLAGYFRKQLISRDALEVFFEQAQALVRGNEYDVASSAIFELVKNSSCSAYDCEYIALAKELEVSCFTYDKKILQQFPTIATRP